MTEDQLCRLWAFARGDTAGKEFEAWFLAQDELEPLLGEDLHWSLSAGNYSERDEVWKLRQSLKKGLEPLAQCQCPSLPDLAALPMGGEGLDERVFATVENVWDHGGDAWWLHLSKCIVCGQNWMIAQEERIFDEYFLRRVGASEVSRIADEGLWPAEFLTYERVLKTGHALNISPCRFLERLAPSLIWTIDDLRKERPDISTEEIASLLGVNERHVAQLLAAAEVGQSALSQTDEAKVPSSTR